MNRRDIELLSAYLDGELKPSDLAKVEARLNSDPELESEMRSMRATRTLLRKLPSRKAPRNFTLTRKMVGQNPPLPRTYPIFRWATIAATLLFFFTIGVNSFSRQMASQNLAYGIGGSGGGGDSESFAESAPAMEAPAEEPAAPEPYADSLDQATELAPTDEGMRIMETPSLKTQEAENIPGEEQVRAAQEIQKPISVTWQITLVGIALIGLLFMYLMRYVSARHWK